MRMWAGLEGRGACGKAFRSFWETSQWDLHRDFQRPWNDVLGGCFPVCGWPNCPQGSGPQAAARWMDPDKWEPLYLSSGVCWQAGGGSMTWNSHEMSLNTTSICSVATDHQSLKPPGPLMGGTPGTETKLDRVLESSPLALGETISTLVTLPCAEELTLMGLCQWAPLLTDTHWAWSSGAREGSEIWAWAPRLTSVPPDGLALTSKEISEENVSLKCYMVPSHMCSKWHTMHIWSLPHIHSWISERLVWMDCDRHLWGPKLDLSSAASVSHCDCCSGNRDGASGLSVGPPLPVTGHFSLFPHVKHQIVQLLILRYIVTSCCQGASNFDLSWSYSQRHVVQSLSMRPWNQESPVPTLPLAILLDLSIAK